MPPFCACLQEKRSRCRQLLGFTRPPIALQCPKPPVWTLTSATQNHSMLPCLFKLKFPLTIRSDPGKLTHDICQFNLFSLPTCFCNDFHARLMFIPPRLDLNSQFLPDVGSRVVSTQRREIENVRDWLVRVVPPKWAFKSVQEGQLTGKSWKICPERPLFHLSLTEYLFQRSDLLPYCAHNVAVCQSQHVSVTPHAFLHVPCLVL